MDINDYLKMKFSEDYVKLNFTRPNTTILRNPSLFKIDHNTIYFGGRNWDNIQNDIIQV